MGTYTTMIEQSLLEQVYKNKDDLASRLVLADWYEENGDQNKADFWRWVENWYPFDSIELRGKVFWMNLAFVITKRDITLKRRQNFVPEEVYNNLKYKRISRKQYPHLAYYETVPEAFEGLFRAWEKCYAQEVTNGKN